MLIHKDCGGQLFHSWRNSHNWKNETGQEFELGSWWCLRCEKEVMSEEEMEWKDLP